MINVRSTKLFFTCLRLLAFANVVSLQTHAMASASTSAPREHFLNIVELECLQQRDGTRCGYFTAFHTNIFLQLKDEVAQCRTQQEANDLLTRALLQPTEADFEAWIEGMGTESKVVIDIDTDEPIVAIPATEHKMHVAKKEFKRSYSTPGQNRPWLQQHVLEGFFPSALTIDPDIQLDSPEYVAHSLMLKKEWIQALYQFMHNEPILIMLNTQTDHWVAALLHPHSKTIFIADSISGYPRAINLLPGIATFFSYAATFAAEVVQPEDVTQLTSAIRKNEPAEALRKNAIPEGFIPFFKDYRETKARKCRESASASNAAQERIARHRTSKPVLPDRDAVLGHVAAAVATDAAQQSANPVFGRAVAQLKKNLNKAQNDCVLL